MGGGSVRVCVGGGHCEDEGAIGSLGPGVMGGL